MEIQKKTFWFDLATNFSIIYTKDSEIDSLNHLKFIFNEMKDELNFKKKHFPEVDISNYIQSIDDIIENFDKAKNLIEEVTKKIPEWAFPKKNLY